MLEENPNKSKLLKKKLGIYKLVQEAKIIRIKAYYREATGSIRVPAKVLNAQQMV